MKRNSSQRQETFVLVFIFLVSGVLGLLLVSQALEAWKASGFSMAEYSVREEVVSARFQVMLGSAGLLYSAGGLAFMLWLHFGVKKKRKI